MVIAAAVTVTLPRIDPSGNYDAHLAHPKLCAGRKLGELVLPKFKLIPFHWQGHGDFRAYIVWNGESKKFCAFNIRWPPYCGGTATGLSGIPFLCSNSV